jgi:aspartate aminotransferase-like enzyme
MSPLFIPGPVDIHPDVLAALSQPMMYHRGAEFETLYHQVEEKARPLFATQRHVYITSFSGTGTMELAMRSFVEKDVLICVSGGFSSRWYDIALANQKRATLLQVEPGKPILPEFIEEQLQKQFFEAVAIVHNETSSGVENPIAKIARLIHEKSPDTLILLDCVSSMGGVPILFDEWQLDYAFGSINKCLAVPPGLAISVASERALDKAKIVNNRGWFLDVLRLEKHHTLNTVPSTPAVSLFYALSIQLDRIQQEGLHNRFYRHQQMAERIAAWGEQNNMAPIAEIPYRSKTMTTVKNGHHLDFFDLRRYLMKHDLEIANGYDEMKDITFRIANMGELQMTDVDYLLHTLETYIAEKKRG